MSQTHWIIRTGDGENFRNSRLPFWGVKRGALNKQTGKRGNGIKTIVEKFKPGDILWFITSKTHGGKIIAMAEYTEFFDKDDEPLVSIRTYANSDQNWKGDEDWSIQIHYKNLYITEKQNIPMVVQHGSPIIKYTKVDTKGEPNQFAKGDWPDLHTHYKNYKFYAEPV